jgi:hypothetical protein
MLAAAVGNNAASVAIVKCCVLALVVSGFIAVATRYLNVSLIGVVLLYGLYFGPQALKHGASITYEEGVLIDLSLCLVIATVFLVRSDLVLAGARRSLMALAAVIIATCMYFVKTTALPTLAVVLLMVLMHPLLRWQLKALSLALVVLPFAFWGAHTLTSSGRIHFSSSWNGENLFRGYNSESVAIYPEISLDREFDSTRAVLDNGTVVPLGNYSQQRCFKDEWAWNDFYANEARRWAVEHPLSALRFDFEKAWVALVGIHHTPTYVSATSKAADYSPALSAVMMVWMIYGRIVFFALCIMILWDARERAKRSYLWVGLLLAGACAPYVMVFSWQRHMIPILLMSGAFLVLLYMSHPQTLTAGTPELVGSES